MSDIRKTLNTLTQLEENCAGAVASVAMPLGATRSRVEEAPEKSPKVATPREWGNWGKKSSGKLVSVKKSGLTESTGTGESEV
jgi:hypothetical protein